ncbi:MAG: hypothetical protein ACK5KP_04130 [Paludibacteraceae bacterium]
MHTTLIAFDYFKTLPADKVIYAIENGTKFGRMADWTAIFHKDGKI